MSTFDVETTANEVAEAFHDQIINKTILITGVTSGSIGAELALTLAKHDPAHLVLVSRSASSISALSTELHSVNPSVVLHPCTMDLSSPKSVREGANKLLNTPEIPKIDVLFLNAGLMAVPTASLTPEGHELQFATNHLGHFLLTQLLLPLLRAPGARIVSVSSTGHRFSDIRYSDPSFSHGEYDKWQAYGQSKTANMLFALSLAKKLKPKGIQAYSLCPGAVATNLARHVPEAEVKVMKAEGHIIIRGTQQGTATHVVAGFDPSVTEFSGAFLRECKVTEPMAYASDPDNAERLWKLSEELLGQKFDIE